MEQIFNILYELIDKKANASESEKLLIDLENIKTTLESKINVTDTSILGQSGVYVPMGNNLVVTTNQEGYITTNSVITKTQLNYLSNVTDDIQLQINNINNTFIALLQNQLVTSNITTTQLNYLSTLSDNIITNDILTNTINNIIDGAPTNFNTLNKIYNHFNNLNQSTTLLNTLNQFNIILNDQNNPVGQISQLLGNKADKSDILTIYNLINTNNQQINAINNSFSIKANENEIYKQSIIDSKLELKADKYNTYNKIEINNKFEEILNAPNILSSLNDITNAFNSNPNLSILLNDAIESKADKITVYTKTSVNNLLGGKQNLIVGAASKILNTNITANKILISDQYGKITCSDVFSTMLKYIHESNSVDIISANLTNNQILIYDGNQIISSGSTVSELIGEGINNIAGYLTTTNLLIANTNNKITNSNILFSELALKSGNLSQDKLLIAGSDGKITSSSSTINDLIKDGINDIIGLVDSTNLLQYNSNKITNSNILFSELALKSGNLSQDKLLIAGSDGKITSSSSTINDLIKDGINDIIGLVDSTNLLQYNSNKITNSNILFTDLITTDLLESRLTFTSGSSILITDANNKPISSNIASSFLSGLTGDTIQNQIDSKLTNNMENPYKVVVTNSNNQIVTSNITTTDLNKLSNLNIKEFDIGYILYSDDNKHINTSNIIKKELDEVIGYNTNIRSNIQEQIDNKKNQNMQLLLFTDQNISYTVLVRDNKNILNNNRQLQYQLNTIDLTTMAKPGYAWGVKYNAYPFDIKNNPWTIQTKVSLEVGDIGWEPAGPEEHPIYLSLLFNVNTNNMENPWTAKNIDIQKTYTSFKYVLRHKKDDNSNFLFKESDTIVPIQSLIQTSTELTYIKNNINGEFNVPLDFYNNISYIQISKLINNDIKITILNSKYELIFESIIINAGNYIFNENYIPVAFYVNSNINATFSDYTVSSDIPENNYVLSNLRNNIQEQFDNIIYYNTKIPFIIPFANLNIIGTDNSIKFDNDKQLSYDATTDFKWGFPYNRYNINFNNPWRIITSIKFENMQTDSYLQILFNTDLSISTFTYKINQYKTDNELIGDNILEKQTIPLRNKDVFNSINYLQITKLINNNIEIIIFNENNICIFETLLINIPNFDDQKIPIAFFTYNIKTIFSNYSVYIDDNNKTQFLSNIRSNIQEQIDINQYFDNLLSNLILFTDDNVSYSSGFTDTKTVSNNYKKLLYEGSSTINSYFGIKYDKYKFDFNTDIWRIKLKIQFDTINDAESLSILFNTDITTNIYKYTITYGSGISDISVNYTDSNIIYLQDNINNLGKNLINNIQITRLLNKNIEICIFDNNGIKLLESVIIDAGKYNFTNTLIPIVFHSDINDIIVSNYTVYSNKLNNTNILSNIKYDIQEQIENIIFYNSDMLLFDESKYMTENTQFTINNNNREIEYNNNIQIGGFYYNSYNFDLNINPWRITSKISLNVIANNNDHFMLKFNFIKNNQSYYYSYSIKKENNTINTIINGDKLSEHKIINFTNNDFFTSKDNYILQITKFTNKNIEIVIFNKNYEKIFQTILIDTSTYIFTDLPIVFETNFSSVTYIIISDYTVFSKFPDKDYYLSNIKKNVQQQLDTLYLQNYKQIEFNYTNILLSSGFDLDSIDYDNKIITANHNNNFIYINNNLIYNYNNFDILLKLKNNNSNEGDIIDFLLMTDTTDNTEQIFKIANKVLRINKTTDGFRYGYFIKDTESIISNSTEDIINDQNIFHNKSFYVNIKRENTSVYLYIYDNNTNIILNRSLDNVANILNSNGCIFGIYIHSQISMITTIEEIYINKYSNITSAQTDNSEKIISNSILKNLIGGANISLNSDINNITINTFGLQSTLNNASGGDSTILSGTTLANISGGTGITIIKDNDIITVNSNITNASGSGFKLLVSSEGNKFVRGLIATSPLSITEQGADSLTISADVYSKSWLDTQLALKAPIANPTFTGTVNGITKVMVGLGNVDNTSDVDKEISIATQTALNLKSDKLTTYTKTESDTQFALKTETQTALDLKAPINDPSFTSNCTVDGNMIVNGTDLLLGALATLRGDSGLSRALVKGNGSTLTINYNGDFTGGTRVMGPDLAVDGDLVVDGVNVMTLLDLKAYQATTYTKTETDTLLNAKEDVLTAGEPANGFPILSGKGIRGLVATAPLNLTNDGSTSLTVGLDTTNIASKAEVDAKASTSYVDNALSNKVSYVVDPALNLNEIKADLIGAETRSYTVVKNDLAVAGNLNVTTDLVIDGTNVLDQLALRAPLANPTFTGTVSGVTKAMVGLGNVDNTTDLNKPISTATQTALNLKAPINNPSFTSNCTVAGNMIVNGSDLILGALETSRGDSGLSRALVKDNNSTLTINYNGDFTGGTRVMGPELAVDGNLNVVGDETIGGNLTCESISGPVVAQLKNLFAPKETTYTITETDALVNSTLAAYYNPFWVAGKYNPFTLTSSPSYGKHSFTVESLNTGLWKINFSTSMPTNDYVILLTKQASGTIQVLDELQPPTSENFHIISYDLSGKQANSIFYFAVLAYPITSII